MENRQSGEPVCPTAADHHAGAEFRFYDCGSAMVESVFSIPGLGSMLVTALGARDTITINACVLLTAVIFVLVNFIADCVNAFLNPQNQKGGGL